MTKVDHGIVRDFVKDKAAVTIGFFLNSFFLILFFYLSTGSKAEIIYPLSLSLFLYLIVVAVEWNRYRRFNGNLARACENMHYELHPETAEQSRAAQTINKIHTFYTQRIHDIHNKIRTREHFLSQWIHNMKTPVSVIDLVLEKALKEGGVTPNTLESLGEENARLKDNLEQVLNLLRLEDFARDFTPEAVDLVATLRKIINSKKNLFIYNNVFPRLELECEEAPVLSDSKWNEIMLEQVISNAVKYSLNGEEGKNIYFTVEGKDNTTMLTIRDEGIGIPPYDITRVFEPFFTGENGRKVRSASGIGLYICSLIAQKLGHEISLESEKGRGTTVRITYLTKL